MCVTFVRLPWYTTTQDLISFSTLTLNFKWKIEVVWLFAISITCRIGCVEYHVLLLKMFWHGCDDHGFGVCVFSGHSHPKSKNILKIYPSFPVIVYVYVPPHKRSGNASNWIYLHFLLCWHTRWLMRVLDSTTLWTSPGLLKITWGKCWRWPGFVIRHWVY